MFLASCSSLDVPTYPQYEVPSLKTNDDEDPTDKNATERLHPKENVETMIHLKVDLDWDRDLNFLFLPTINFLSSYWNIVMNKIVNRI